MQDVTTIEACYKATGNDLELRKIFAQLPEKKAKQQLANYDRGIITEAINMNDDGTRWIPDMTDSSQWKYWLYVWVKKDPSHSSGLGFSVSHSDGSLTATLLGSRFAFKGLAEMNHAFKYFEEVFKDDILIV